MGEAVMPTIIPFDQVEDDSPNGSLNFIPFDQVDDDSPNYFDTNLATAPVKGFITGLEKAVLAPADLLFYGGNKLAELLGAEKKDLSGWYPSEMAIEGLSNIGLAYPDNTPIESGAERFLKGAGEFPGSFIGATGPFKALSSVLPKSRIAAALAAGPETMPLATLGGSLGQGTAEAVAPESGLASLLLSTGGMIAPSAAKGVAKGGYNALRDLLIGETVTEELVKRGVGEVASQYTNLPKLSQVLAANKPIAYQDTMRVAEQARDPGLALLTKTLEKADITGGVRGRALDQARQEALLKDFAIAQGPTYSTEQTGNIIRQGLEPNRAKLSKQITRAYEAAQAKPSNIKIQSKKYAINTFMNSIQKLGAPIDSETTNLVKSFSQLPKEGVDLATLDAFRKQAGELVGVLRNPETLAQKNGARVASKLFGLINEAEQEAVQLAGKGKGLTATQAKSISKGRELTAKRGELYGEGATGDILEKGRYRGYDASSSDVLGKAISSPEEGRQVIQALKGEGRSQQALRSGLMENLKTRSTDPSTKEFIPRSFVQNWRKVAPVAKEVLAPAQIKAIDKVGENLSSMRNYESMIYHASKGNPSASQSEAAIRSLKGAVTLALSKKFGLFSQVFSGARAARAQVLENKIQEGLIELAFNPKYVNDILAAPKDIGALNRIVGYFTPKLQTVASSITGSISGVLANRESDSKKNSNLAGSIMEQNSLKQDISFIEQEIDQDPFDSAVYEIESSRNPLAKNPESSASGGFQLISSTAKKLGVKDVFNLGDNYSGFKKLKEENMERFGDDPALLYSAHYLGATVLDKALKGEPLREGEQLQVNRLRDVLLPRFMRIYEKRQKALGAQSERV